ncbi:recombinase family protein [Actinomycetospora lutea]|uniref:recombinase family protein n=1 Tax=Actinomycetospora lutea TaxID=663604 RepID=UPI002365610E|nr:recombinase family protein [Actinomycetospora lutea]MDD7942887.1 recombinase family protein [Actinomycetospora lutea]
MASPRRPRRDRPANAPVRALGYLRVSSGDQVDSGAGLDAQRAALTSRAALEGWQLEVVADEGLSAKNVDGRPELVAALRRLDAGDADVLVTAKLDRVSRSVRDFAGLLDRARDNGWRLVLLDLGIDTITPAGEFVSNTLASAAQYERRIIGQRTREGLAAKRAQGVRLGRPSIAPAEVVARVVDRVAAGAGWSAIARELNADGVPTPSGKPVARWFPNTVRQVAHGQDAARLAS